MTISKKIPYYRIVLGAMISSCFHTSKTNTIPSKIRGYNLVKEISSNKSNKYHTGVYTKNHKNYVIKTWEGKIKDFQYFNLINEYKVNQLLEKNIEKVKTSIKLRVPKIIEIFESHNALSVVYEHIGGRKISNTKEKVDVFTEILKNLRTVSQTIPRHDIKQLSYRPLWFYLLAFPLLTLLYVIKQPSSSNIALLSLIKSFTYFFSFKKTIFTLSHRDIHVDNILLQNNCIYLFDFENFVVTLPAYDLAYIIVESTSEYFRNKIVNQIGLTPHPALVRFIAMQQTFCANNTMVKHYTKCLKTYYEK